MVTGVLCKEFVYSIYVFSMVRADCCIGPKVGPRKFNIQYKTVETNTQQQIYQNQYFATSVKQLYS